jgi:hypothetical protein
LVCLASKGTNGAAKQASIVDESWCHRHQFSLILDPDQVSRNKRSYFYDLTVRFTNYEMSVRLSGGNR